MWRASGSRAHQAVALFRRAVAVGYAKHNCYGYRGVSKYHFPMYSKEIEHCLNHRKENVFKRFLKIYFGCVSP